jgi:signal peptidase I
MLHMSRHACLRLLLCLAGGLTVCGCGTSGVATVSDAGMANGGSGPAKGARVYRVTSGSMEPTLPIGAKVLVKKGPVAVGDVVVYHPPEGFATQKCGPKPHVVKTGGAACDAAIRSAARVELVKRVVAGPGDQLYIRKGYVYRKARNASTFVVGENAHIHACRAGSECDFPIPVKVPAGHWFLMGDNRGESDDSRFWGPVPTAWIVGIVTGRVR